MIKYRILFFLLLLQGCGFSSGLYQDILDAQEYLKSQNFDKAISTYKKILDKKPSKQIQLKIHYQLGDIYSIYLSKYYMALKHYNKFLNLTEDPLIQVTAIEKMALINFENLKNYKESIGYFQKLLKFEPPLEKNNFYQFKNAQALFQMKKYKKSTKELLILTKTKNNEYSVQAYYYLGLINFYLEKWDVAISYWFEYLKRESRKDKIVHAKFLIANAYESSENLKKAYNIYYSIVGEYPNPKIIKSRLKALYERRVARKR